MEKRKRGSFMHILEIRVFSLSRNQHCMFFVFLNSFSLKTKNGNQLTAFLIGYLWYFSTSCVCNLSKWTSVLCWCVFHLSSRWGDSQFFFCFTKLGAFFTDRNTKMLDNLCVGFGLIKIYRLLGADTHTQSSLIV